MAGFKIEVSPGELLDRLTILEIKLEHITDPPRRNNIVREYEALPRVPPDEAVETLVIQLKDVNRALWQTEDALRSYEHHQDFGAAFVALARSVYRNNDRRSALKRQINEHFDCPLTEEKSYTRY